jgi:hypothetical protein
MPELCERINAMDNRPDGQFVWREAQPKRAPLMRRSDGFRAGGDWACAARAWQASKPMRDGERSFFSFIRNSATLAAESQKFPNIIRNNLQHAGTTRQLQISATALNLRIKEQASFLLSVQTLIDELIKLVTQRRDIFGGRQVFLPRPERVIDFFSRGQRAENNTLGSSPSAWRKQRTRS